MDLGVNLGCCDVVLTIQNYARENISMQGMYWVGYGL